MRALSSVFIVGAKRTPFGSFGGSFKDLSATTLAVLSTKEAIRSSNVPESAIDTAIFGNVAQTSSDAPYLARHVALKSGLNVETPALTLNRLCGSGFQAVVSAAEELLLSSHQNSDQSFVALAGGTENMTQAPFAARNIRFGDRRLGQNIELEDTLWNSLTDAHVGLPMGITAENLAQKYGVSRQECDAFALRSQKRWKAAADSGAFADEIVGVTVKAAKKGTPDPVVSLDEHPRPTTTAESLAKLPPVFKKDGTVTAGNASGISDGAASLLLANEVAVKAYGLKPLAKVLAWKAVGCPPEIMGIGPASAIRSVLKATGLSLAQISLLEVNEAFAPQVLSVLKELEPELKGYDIEGRFNACGGAIALGHPLAASGARILTHLTHQLRRTGGQYAIGSACIGGGQGIAVLIEAIN